jgi:hypothetical protein
MQDRTAVAKFAADIHRVVARHAESHQKQFGPNPDLEDRVKRHRAQARQLGLAIALSGKWSVAPASTPAFAAPRERRETPTRKTGDSGDSGDDPEPPPSRRLDGRRDIERWIAERNAAVSALVGQLCLFKGAE